jgi:ABC-2 type transport system permease protein
MMLFTFNVEKEIYSRVMQGNIAVDFMRPTSVILSYLSEDIGTIIGSFVIKFIPMFLVISLVYFIPKPAGLLPLFLFIVSVIFSFMILWLLDAIIGMLHIRLIDLGDIGFIKTVLVELLSGAIIPIWFLPDSIQRVFSFFPFQYTFQTPLGIYIGKFTVLEGLKSMSIQLIWICILLILLNIMWSKASKNILIQGG